MYLRDIEFVLEEVIRFLKLDISEHRKLSFEDAFSTLPDPRHKGGILICGVKAEERLRSLARLAISRSKHVGRLDVLDFVREMKAQIAQRFLKEKRELSSTEADRVVGAALRAGAKKCEARTHLIPCKLVTDKLPEMLAIGPVKFARREQRMAALQPTLDGYAGIGGIEKQLSDDAKRYYGSFDWIVEITLESCQPSISESRSRDIAQYALDCLHLLIGAGYSRHMRIGGRTAQADLRSSIAIGADAAPHITTTRSWDSHTLEDGWWTRIQDNLGYKPVIELMGIALAGAHQFTDQPPMAMRFLDAAAWYGEAARDRFPAARAIKYVTAIERILTTKSEKNITETIARRGAALLERTGYEGAHEADIRRVYKLRSDLVHGTNSPFEMDWPSLKLAEDLSRRIILSFLPFCDARGLKDTDLTTSSLDQAYDRLVSFVQAKSATAALGASN